MISIKFKFILFLLNKYINTQLNQCFMTQYINIPVTYFLTVILRKMLYSRQRKVVFETKPNRTHNRYLNIKLNVVFILFFAKLCTTLPVCICFILTLILPHTSSSYHKRLFLPLSCGSSSAKILKERKF